MIIRLVKRCFLYILCLVALTLLFTYLFVLLESVATKSPVHSTAVNIFVTLVGAACIVLPIKRKYSKDA